MEVGEEVVVEVGEEVVVEVGEGMMAVKVGKKKSLEISREVVITGEEEELMDGRKPMCDEE